LDVDLLHYFFGTLQRWGTLLVRKVIIPHCDCSTFSTNLDWKMIRKIGIIARGVYTYRQTDDWLRTDSLSTTLLREASETTTMHGIT
jgi:hypothetical protein